MLVYLATVRAESLPLIVQALRVFCNMHPATGKPPRG